MKPLYIFDLDGTLALSHHRLHLLDNKNDPHRWRKFYAACAGDKPNVPVIDTMDRLYLSGADIWIFSGRSDEVRDDTIDWLVEHTSFIGWEVHKILTMREEGDHTVDHILKKRWLDSMLVDDRRRLVAVFDDRDQVVQMWRDCGVACYQVAAGAF